MWSRFCPPEKLIEMDSLRQKRRAKPRRAAYLLPNLFTTGVVMAGFYSVLQSVGGNYEKACLAIIVAMVLDVVDGLVARMTSTQSPFGAEYDSLADVIAFGLAPALLAYQWGLSEITRLGTAIAFIYLAATAIRLARFNVSHAGGKDFIGLPCPAAAALVTSFVWLAVQYFPDAEGYVMPALGAAITLITALSMVGNVRYPSLKRLEGQGKITLRYQIAVVFSLGLLGMLADDLPALIFLLFAIYWASGYATFLLSLAKRFRLRG